MLNKQPPLAVRTVKAKPCSWIDGDIKRLMHHRDYLKKNYQIKQMSYYSRRVQIS
jgi:hypothetical protein